jgi:hypothetical protein
MGGKMIGLSERPAVRNDIPQILEIYKQNPTYDLDVFHNVIKDSVVTFNEEVVAYGVLKHFAEAVMVIDHTRSKNVQVTSFKQLMDQAVKVCQDMKIQDLHVFTENLSFSDILINKFDFHKINGVGLLRRIDG